MSLQKIARSPRRWEAEIKCVNARHRGLRTLERRIRSNGRQEIADQLAQTEPSQSEIEYEHEKCRQEAMNVLIAINEEYEAEIAAARRKQSEAIAALPYELRSLIECEYDWGTHYYYVS
jgi:DNA-directed RNA polymerase sigma subunit (sigma70/sigma32)